MSCRWISRTPECLLRLAFGGVCSLFLASVSVSHPADRTLAHVPDARKVGEGRLRYFFWDIYDAVLYAPQGFWKDEPPFALRLSYLRAIPGKDIADRSAEEIRKQGFDDSTTLAAWHRKMREIFPDVKEGLRLTGVYTVQGHTVFYKNTIEIGRFTDPNFGRAFFAIWLSEKSRFPALRRQLLGEK